MCISESLQQLSGEVGTSYTGSSTVVGSFPFGGLSVCCFGRFLRHRAKIATTKDPVQTIRIPLVRPMISSMTCELAE